MPHKDPEKRRESVRTAVAAHRQRARDATAEAMSGELPEAPTQDELIRMLGVRAREGNVPAMKLLLERAWERKKDADNRTASDDPLAGIDELAQRRQRAA